MNKTHKIINSNNYRVFTACGKTFRTQSIGEITCNMCKKSILSKHEIWHSQNERYRYQK